MNNSKKQNIKLSSFPEMSRFTCTNKYSYVRESLWPMRLQVREDNPRALASGLSRPKPYNNCHIAPACNCTLNMHCYIFDGNVIKGCNNVYSSSS